MTKRLSKMQQQYILREMISLARALTTAGLPAPHVKDAVGQLKADLIKAYRQGITVMNVDRNTYLEQRTGQASTGETR
jgi:hypothetical protein